MKLELIRSKEVVVCTIIGFAGALIFLFAFPKGSISTLMHEVLGLPGPGAGIAVIVGPFIVLLALLASLLTRGNGGAVVAAVTFAMACALLVWLLRIPSNPKGAFGSAVFVVAAALPGITVEAVMLLGKALKKVWRCMLCGALANAILLLIYWVMIFPRTAGWIGWNDVPLLMGLCLACGLASGYTTWAVSKPLSRALALKERE